MAQVAFLISGDADKLSKALAKADAQFSKAEKGANDTAKAVARITKEEREAAKEMARFQREAERIKQSVQSPMERYSQQVMKLERHLEAGRIEQHEYTAAVAKLKQEMREASPAFDRLKKSEKSAADELRRLKTEATSIKDSVRTPIERYRSEVAKLEKHLEAGTIDQREFNRAVDQAKTKMKAAGESGRNAFNFHGQLGALATSFIGVSAAIQAVAGSINNARQAAKEAADAQVAARIDMGTLSQVATSKEDFRGLRKSAEALYAGGAASTKGEAAQIAMSIRSANQDEAIGLYSKLGGTGVVADVVNLAKAVETLRSSMGVSETGGVRDVISKGFGASQFSPESMESLLKGAARAGTGASAMGISDEEILAATSVTATSKGSSEQAGTRLASLMKSLQRMGAAPLELDTGKLDAAGKSIKKRVAFDFKGDDLMTMLGEVKQAGLGDAEMIKAFGSDESLESYRILMQNRQKYESALSTTRRAQTGDLVGEKLSYVENDPELMAAWARRKAEAGEELSRERIGVTSNLYESFRKQHVANKRKQGRWEITTGLDEWNEDFRRSWYGEDHLLREAMRSGQLDGVDPALQKRIREHYGETVKAGRVRPGQTSTDIARDGAQHLAGGELKEAARELASTAREQREAAREMRETMAKHDSALEATRRTSLGDPNVDK